MSRLFDPLSGLHAAMKSHEFSPLTNKAYTYWVERFLDYHKSKSPETLATNDIPLFLKHLVLDYGVSSATQRQVLTAIIFFYEHVLGKDLRGERKALIKSLLPRVCRE